MDALYIQYTNSFFFSLTYDVPCRGRSSDGLSHLFSALRDRLLPSLCSRLSLLILISTRHLLAHSTPRSPPASSSSFSTSVCSAISSSIQILTLALHAQKSYQTLTSMMPHFPPSRRSSRRDSEALSRRGSIDPSRLVPMDR
jgi:hypothetical protein